MLEEAIEVIRLLWEGGQQTHRGEYHDVPTARIYDLPETPPKIIVSGFGAQAIDLAARIGDGFGPSSPTPRASPSTATEVAPAPSRRA
jgi:alkanesulfonate monooxygenase SsuD/methylene tetrahydromethanopterin reductase-like flavin-dependent oxidoreductase (luciferase family)